jgi:CheY-like chemotaxis protein
VVLVVEDEELVRVTAVEMIEDAGFAVLEAAKTTAASNAQDASMSAFRSRQPAVRKNVPWTELGCRMMLRS